jgi:hypothetical protein
LGTQVHHHDAVAVAEQKFGVADDSSAVVGDAVEEQNPITRRRRRTNFPSPQLDAVFCSNGEIFFRVSAALQRFFNQLEARGRDRQAPWMEDSGADHFSYVIGKDWQNREERDCGDEKYPYHPLE